MKVMTLIGTRPEIIRLSRIIPKLDALCKQVLVHTGQNYDHNLNDVFMKQLGVRAPNYQLDSVGTFGEQLATTLTRLENIIDNEKPDAFLVLGDTNSSLGAIMAKRLGVRVFHMEAGNRCYDDRVPEEVNRRLIDHSSDVLMPYTERSRQNLLAEGIHSSRIFVTGNPIREVLDYYASPIEDSDIMERLEIQPQKYMLVTLHRAENVDDPERLDLFLTGLGATYAKFGLPIIFSVHPRTQNRLGGVKMSGGITAIKPVGLFDFVKMEQNAKVVMTDSGTVQEECSILGTPCVTLRDATERPETIEVGSNLLTGSDPYDIVRGVEAVFHNESKWVPPAEYCVENVSDTIVNIVTGYHR